MRFLVFFLLLVSMLFGSERTFLDIDGKEITLPKQLTRVFSTAPPISFLLYAIDDKALIGVNFPQVNKSNKHGSKFLSKHFMSLPVLGSWHGNNVPNLETILKAKPELIVTWDTPLLNKKVMKDLEKISIPAIKVNIDDARNYPKVFRYLGKVFNKQKRAEKLARLSEQYLKEIDQFTKTIPQGGKVKVYYAEGEKGLLSDCDKSFHTEAFNLAGVDLVHKCVQSTVLGLQQINFEQVMKYDPDVIMVQSAYFFRHIFKDKKWKTLRAVKNKKVYLIPNTPFNWVDRPPSFMRILSAHWIASKVYPDRYCHSIREKIEEFYKLFFNVELSDEDMEKYFYL
jgi:iron complex transport system substrate-binding protein